MNQISKVILIISLVVVALIVGVYAGFAYEKQASASSLIARVANAEKVTKNLSSKVVGSITLYGKIISISGRILILAADKDSLPVTIKTTAQIFESVPQKDKTGKTISSTQQKIEFKDLKVGYVVAVPVKLLPSWQ